MSRQILWPLLLPLAGTSLGAACVFLMKRTLNDTVQRVLMAFAAGVMTAASVWSLLIPSMEMAGDMGRFAYVPAVSGFLAGVLFLLILDRVIPHVHPKTHLREGPRSRLQQTTMMILAVTLHNIPEGMAVGVVCAGALAGGGVTSLAALTLALGIAIQNFPEGAIISMPLRAEGTGRGKAILWGVLSGAVEPVCAALTVAASSLAVPLLPYLLSFAAGAMIYVVVEELIPEMSAGRHMNVTTLVFSLGFCLMLALDTALG